MARKRRIVKQLTTRDRISEVLQRWFLREPLLFAVWTTHKLAVEPRIQTIRVRQERIEYNPDFIKRLNDRELELVLKYEATRILLKHPYQRRKENPTVAYTASNITLQEYLREPLPIPSAKDTFGTDEYDQQYYEFYYYRLLEEEHQPQGGNGNDANQNMQGGMGGGGASSSDEMDEDTPQEAGGDSADGSGAGGGSAGGEDNDEQQQSAGGQPQQDQEQPQDSSSPEFEDDAQEQQQPAEQPKEPLDQYADAEANGRDNTQDWDVNELLNDRINDHIRVAHESNRWGSVAGRFKERVLASLRPKLDYRAVLRQFRTSVLSVQRTRTRMKPSRRYGFQYMGSRRDFTTKLLFAVDVSGSVTSKDLSRGFSVVNRFFKYGIESIDVIQFDTEIKGEPQSLKKAKHEVKVLGRGGTRFHPLIDYINENKEYDGMIIFTDGFAPVPPKPTNRRTRILWLFNNQSNYEGMEKNLQHIGRSAYLKED
ncbi:MAG: VWA-like domain-containing protein [Chloroflexota bacterium]